MGSVLFPKKMSSQFPTDDGGQYLTLGYLHEMENAEYVTVFYVKTNIEAVFISTEVVQDSSQFAHNLEKSTKRIHFKQQKNVIVDYTINLTGEEKSINLRNLKQVRERD